MEGDLDTRCPICLENWDSAAYTMPCRHQFCFHCIQRWTSTRPQCPLCKQGVSSIIHSVRADNDYEELVLRAAPVASIATQSHTSPLEAQPWPAVPVRSVGGLSPATWASLFREHPALLQPLRSWLRRKLRRMLGAEETAANVVAYSVIWALLVFGLAEDILVEMLEPELEGHVEAFVRQFIAFAVQRCSREAHVLLGFNVPPAAGAEEPSSAAEPSAAPHQEAPVPGPVPSSSPASSNRDATPGRAGEELNGHRSRQRSNPETAPVEQTASAHEEPEVPVAGPSGTSRAQQTRRAPKRKATASQASSPSKKRPPSRQE